MSVKDVSTAPVSLVIYFEGGLTIINIALWLCFNDSDAQYLSSMRSVCSHDIVWLYIKNESSHWVGVSAKSPTSSCMLPYSFETFWNILRARRRYFLKSKKARQIPPAVKQSRRITPTIFPIILYSTSHLYSWVRRSRKPYAFSKGKASSL